MTSFKLSVFKEYLKIREYSKLKGKGTELITLIVPSSKTPEYVLNKLKQQKQETANVKSKQTRKAILEALDRIIFYLKKTPPTQSCIILSGLIDNKMYFEVFFFPGVNSFNYHCSDHFRLDKIIEYVGFNNYYLATMTLNESTVCLMEDNQLKTLKKFVSYVPSKTKKGGQSARRYAQIRENEKREFFFRVSSFINQLPKKEYPLLLGGSVPTVDSFISDKYLSVDVKKKIVGPYYLQNQYEEGIKEMINSCIQELLNFKKEEEEIQLNKARYSPFSVTNHQPYELLVPSSLIETPILLLSEIEHIKQDITVTLIGDYTPIGSEFNYLNKIVIIKE